VYSAVKVLFGTLHFKACLVQMLRIPNNVFFTHIKVTFLCNVQSMSYVYRIVSFSGLHLWFSASLMCPLLNKSFRILPCCCQRFGLTVTDTCRLRRCSKMFSMWFRCVLLILLFLTIKVMKDSYIMTRTDALTHGKVVILC
jgi:hypothetical protein